MIDNFVTLVMNNKPAIPRSGEPPVLSSIALVVPFICGATLLAFDFQAQAFLIGVLSFFMAIPSVLLCLCSLVIRERPRWIAGVAFLANCLLINSITFINLH